MQQRMVVVRTNRLFYKLLRSGHFQPQSTSNYKFQKCQKSHHTLLYLQFDCTATARASNRAGHGKMQGLLVEVDNYSTCHSSHLSYPDHSGKRSTLLMTCQITVVASDGQMTKARPLLECSSSTSFIMEHLVQRL